MAFHDVAATVRLPVKSSGCSIIDCDGSVIAEVTNRNPWMASAIADLINLGTPAALQRRADYDARQAEVRAMFARAMFARYWPSSARGNEKSLP